MIWSLTTSTTARQTIIKITLKLLTRKENNKKSHNKSIISINVETNEKKTDVELKICTSNMIFQTYAEKRKVIKQQHQKKTETNTHLSTSIKKLQLQKITYQYYNKRCTSQNLQIFPNKISLFMVQKNLK